MAIMNDCDTEKMKATEYEITRPFKKSNSTSKERRCRLLIERWLAESKSGKTTLEEIYDCFYYE